MHPHATIADHNLGMILSITRVSQQIFVLFSINNRIRLLSLMSESLKGVPFVSLSVGSVYYLSRVMSKSAFCICKNKGADQLRDNRIADQNLCFRFIDNAILLLPKSYIFKPIAIFVDVTDMIDEKFYRDAAHPFCLTSSLVARAEDY